MTQIARLYGSSMYDLAAEEQLTDTVLEQMQTIRQLFRENPDYVKLLSEPSIPKEERTKLLDTAFGTEAERYLVNFLKLLCERGILGEYSGCCEEFTRRYNVDHNIATAVVTSAVALTDEQMAALKDKLEKTYGLHKGNRVLCARAGSFLEELKAENNYITRMWEQCGMKASNAADSQALIQLKKEYCDKKKYLYCRIGYEYLKRS